MQQSITQKVRFVLIASLIFLFAMSFLAYSSLSQFVGSSRHVSHTYTVILKLSELRSSMKEAETSQRGYLLTSNPAFLENYYGKGRKATELYKELETLTADNNVQQERLNKLKYLIAARFERLEQIIRQHRKDESYDLEASNLQMQEVNTVINQMQQEEDRLLNERQRREGLYSREAPVFILLLCFLSILIAFVAFYRIRKDVRKREIAEALLEKSNYELEKKVEERTREIRKNEERYRFMAESIPHIVWTATPEGRVEYFSQLMNAYTGVPVEELLGWNWQQVIHPGDVQKTLDQWTDSLAEGKEFRMEHRLLGQDGIYRWMLTHAVPYKKAEGEVVKWFGTTTLIDDEKKATDNAKQQEERLKRITDALPVLISYIDSNLYFRFVNEKYCKWFEKEQDEIVNHAVIDVVGKKAYEAVMPVLKKALRGEQVSQEVQTYYETQGNRTMKINAIPHWMGEKVLGFYNLIYDVTLEKKAEERLRRALLDSEVKNVELKRVNHILDDFVSMAAHDLKSPVSNLKMSVSLINKLQNTSDKIKIIDQFDTSVQRLDRTLSGLLEILEVQHVQETQADKFLFADILFEVLENLGDRLRQAGGEIETEFDEAPAINFIKPYLVSILSNLLSNSIKYAAAERPLQIQLKTWPAHNGVFFSCTDNGIGMDLQKIGNKIFKPFKRFSAQAEGTGVGLHLIKSMLERNGGTIEVFSEPGLGTRVQCFFKNLPLNEEVV